MVSLREAQLRQIMTRIKTPDLWMPALNQAMEKFDIDTPDRAAAFLAQIAHESGELTVTASPRISTTLPLAC